MGVPHLWSLLSGTRTRVGDRDACNQQKADGSELSEHSASRAIIYVFHL
jgi:hypothetical protein